MKQLRTLIPLTSLALLLLAANHARAVSLSSIITDVQPRIVKIYGAGGFRGLEAYQSGFLVSADGHIATVWSYVLDTEFVTVTLDDGRKYDAKLVGIDPRLEIAVLKIEEDNLPHFDLQASADAATGTRVLAFSNLFGIATGDERASVLQGTVAVKSQLEARRGVFETSYNGPVYVLDAITNNPGAAGGALTNRNGELLGMLGKELRNSLSNTWLNYAVPADVLRESIDAIREGRVTDPGMNERPRPQKSLDLANLGLVLVPDVLERTPPFVDAVRPNSAASEAGLQPDDLVLFINERLVQSIHALAEELQFIDHEDEITLTVIRGEQQLLDFVLQAPRNDE